MKKIIWLLHKICIGFLLIEFAAGATYAYDIAACFHEFGFQSDDCHETTSFVLTVISPLWAIAVLITYLILIYLSKKCARAKVVKLVR
jgi:hypothetical protein